MNRFRIVLFSVLFFSLLVGCQSNKEDYLNFSGEGEYWSAHIISNTDKNTEINLTYLGNNADSVGDFGVNLHRENDFTGIGISDMRLNKEGKAKEVLKDDLNIEKKESKNMILTVNWNDNKSEEITLKNK